MRKRELYGLADVKTRYGVSYNAYKTMDDIEALKLNLALFVYNKKDRWVKVER